VTTPSLFTVLTIVALLIQVYVVIVIALLSRRLLSLAWIFINTGLGVVLIKWVLLALMVSRVVQGVTYINLYEELSVLSALCWAVGFTLLYRDAKPAADIWKRIQDRAAKQRVEKADTQPEVAHGSDCD